MIMMIDVVRTFNHISEEITKNGPKINEDLSENGIIWIDNMRMKIKLMLRMKRGQFFTILERSLKKEMRYL